MAINWIENQPVLFGVLPDDCNYSNINETRLVNVGDISQVQFRLTTCDNAINAIANGGFNTTSNWTISGGSGWAIIGGRAIHTIGNSGYLYQASLVPGVLYAFTFTVSGRTKGGVTLNSGNLFGGETFNETVSENGAYTFYGTAGTTGQIQFLGSTDFDGSIDDVYAYPVKANYIVSVWDNTDTYLTQINSIVNPTLFVYDRDTLTISIDWEALGITTEGCYVLKLHDPCINTNLQNGVYNGDFTFGDSGWQFLGYGSFGVTGGKGVFSAGSTSSLGAAARSQYSFVANGKSYSVTYTLSGISGGVNVAISLGGTIGTERTTNGTFTETITAGSTGVVDIAYSSVGAFAGGGVTIDDLIITLADGQDLISNQTSNTFKIGTFDCAVFLNGCNNSDGMGFNFEASNFVPRLRLDARLMPPDAMYITKRTQEEDSIGSLNTVYFKTRKRMILAIVAASVYELDFINLCRGLDHFYIDGVEYSFVVDEFPNVKWNKLRTAARVDLEVTKKTQLFENVNTGAENTNCAIGDDYLIDSDGGFIVDGSDGGKIIID